MRCAVRLAACTPIPEFNPVGVGREVGDRFRRLHLRLLKFIPFGDHKAVVRCAPVFIVRG